MDKQVVKTKLKIGARVESPDFGLGTVIGIQDYCYHGLPVLVEFDNKQEVLHNGMSDEIKGKEEQCYWYRLNGSCELDVGSIELVPVTMSTTDGTKFSMKSWYKR